MMGDSSSNMEGSEALIYFFFMTAETSFLQVEWNRMEDSSPSWCIEVSEILVYFYRDQYFSQTFFASF